LSGSATLYTREVLALATSLSQWPLDPGMPLSGAARSPTCGSAIALSLATDHAGAIAKIGLKAQACAIGQASAAIFAAAAAGRDVGNLSAALGAITCLHVGRQAPSDVELAAAPEPSGAVT